MGRQTKAKMVAQHEAEIADLRSRYEDRIEAMEKDAKELKETHRLALVDERRQTFVEQQTRMAAQRGLVPYVRSLEQLNGWLLERPELRHALRPILQELGLWEIKLGYDPDQDLGLSAISPHRA